MTVWHEFAKFWKIFPPEGFLKEILEPVEGIFEYYCEQFLENTFKSNEDVKIPVKIHFWGLFLLCRIGYHENSPSYQRKFRCSFFVNYQTHNYFSNSKKIAHEKFLFSKMKTLSKNGDKRLSTAERVTLGDSMPLIAGKVKKLPAFVQCKNKK